MVVPPCIDTSFCSFESVVLDFHLCQFCIGGVCIHISILNTLLRNPCSPAPDSYTSHRDALYHSQTVSCIVWQLYVSSVSRLLPKVTPLPVRAALGARRRRSTSRYRSLFLFLVVLSVFLFTPGFNCFDFCGYIGHLLPAVIRAGLSL